MVWLVWSLKQYLVGVDCAYHVPMEIARLQPQGGKGKGRGKWTIYSFTDHHDDW